MGAGLCECGCGQPTSIAKRSNKRLGHVVGQPVRFVAGHHNRGKKMPKKNKKRGVLPCSVEGCGGKYWCSGMCQKHYSRLHRTGTTDPGIYARVLEMGEDERRGHDAQMRRARYRRFIENNPEAKLQRDADYRERNRATLNEKQKAYYAEHKVEKAAYDSGYREANRDKLRAYHRKNAKTIAAQKRLRRRMNPERERQVFRTWYAKWAPKNRDKIRTYAHRRRQRVGEDVLSADIVARLRRAQRSRCVACGCDLRVTGYHIDHIIPLARGGRNIDSNVQLLCPTCNARKGARDPVEFMQEHGYLL